MQALVNPAIGIGLETHEGTSDGRPDQSGFGRGSSIPCEDAQRLGKQNDQPRTHPRLNG